MDSSKPRNAQASLAGFFVSSKSGNKGLASRWSAILEVGPTSSKPENALRFLGFFHGPKRSSKLGEISHEVQIGSKGLALLRRAIPKMGPTSSKPENALRFLGFFHGPKRSSKLGA
jgi:hypothetical protein